MFEKFFENLRKQHKNQNIQTRRRFSRRACDKCVGIINNRTYPVEDWSLGGLLLHGDSRIFPVGQEVNVTLKFKLRDRILDIPHKARVVRKSHEKVGLAFLPMPRDTRENFQHVIDDYVAGSFTGSSAG